MKRVYRFRQDGKDLDEEQYKLWLEANGFGKNFAGTEGIADRAATFVDDSIRLSTDYKNVMLQPWQFVDAMLRGESLAENTPLGTGDIHVPEVEKALEVLVPRIVEGIQGFGNDIFHVIPRREGDRRRAMKLEEWIRYQFSLSRWNDELEDRIRCGLLYGVCPVYIGWESRYQTRPVKTLRREKGDDGQIVNVISVEPKKIRTYCGITQRMVDPRDFIYDASRMDPKRARFAGETMKLSVSELLHMEAAGILEGVAQAIEGSNPNARGLLQAKMDQIRAERDQASRAGASGSTEFQRKMEAQITADQNGRVPCVSLWGEWSESERPLNADDWGQWQFFYVNGAPCRIAKNPYDSQHIPYAVARVSREPFFFWALSPILQALPINAEADQHRALGSRSHALAVSPFILADENTDLPADSLANMEVGSVIRAQLDKAQIQKFPSTVGDTVAMFELLRRDIREVMGAPEAISGTGDENTATQFQGNLREANRRIRGAVNRYAFDCEKAAAEMVLLLSQQFVTDDQQFRAMGRGAQELGFSPTLRPEDLLDPVDIEMVGPQTFGSNGERATKMIALLNQAQFLIAAEAQKGNIDTGEWLREVFTGVMGYRMSDRLLKTTQRPEDVLDPERENRMLRKVGMRLDVHPLDDDAEHWQVHAEDAARAEEDGEPDEVLQQFAEHMQAHQDQQQQKAAVERAKQSAMALAQQPGAAASSGFPESDNAPQDGRTYQRGADMQNETPQTTPPGQTPGPPDLARQGAPDRRASIFQTVNQ